ncbi:GNAT family N-acetyltransferase [Desulforamulus ruminis]|uniref:GCN5-related N-acetyltransferase n=1 Tax=Desulforamulus ruminis (strain ATCC 23193 / DSM 2154 / NCIMB 8452 / DL) TaxID=696281 RepID=F6DRU9_DESRL|nr:GNAT family N-acetyltransferase [Desulforamulus ruminis]AEG59860.1 GCN5-related N-acetyltransferase [Desulforamulus ruminis DSM 2154]
MHTDISIRMATEADAKEILEIYAPYITDTAVTFEYSIPSVAEFSQRIRDTLQMYPYIVALEDDRIVGYAYASAFKKRAAYNWAVETTVYLKQDCRGRGLGKKLYFALEEILKRQNIINLNACIAYTLDEDAHLDNTSTIFHEHLGYTKVAHFTKCGYKFGAWYDMIWMEKMLGEHPSNPDPVIPITELQVL